MNASEKLRSELMEALKAVKIPGGKVDVMEQGLLSKLDVRESSVVVAYKFPEANPMYEKSVKYQTETAFKNIRSDLQVAVEFSVGASQQKELSEIEKIGSVIAVGSGKGGVGKSSFAVNLAVAYQKLGYSVGILDCDVYGPSIPTMLGVENQKPVMLDNKIQPIEAHGIKLMSAGFFVEPGQSLVWRGPMIHKLVQQFANDVSWGGVDVLIVDLPPGTGDAALSLAQTIPLTGAVMVSMPQHISLIDVHKGISMFQHLKVPILGIVENMSYFSCNKCHHEEAIFDRGGVEKFCKEMGLPYLGDVPIDPRIRALSDMGRPFLLDNESTEAGKALVSVAKRLEAFLQSSAKTAAL